MHCTERKEFGGGFLFVCLFLFFQEEEKKQFLGWEETFTATRISRILRARLMGICKGAGQEYPLHRLLNRNLVTSTDGGPQETQMVFFWPQIKGSHEMACIYHCRGLMMSMH